MKEPKFNHAGICKWNIEISCTDKGKCDKCGWNPNAEELRKKRVIEQLRRQK